MKELYLHIKHDTPISNGKCWVSKNSESENKDIDETFEIEFEDINDFVSEVFYYAPYELAVDFKGFIKFA